MSDTSLERNDIDISKLFSWSGKFTIQNRFGTDVSDVYIRLVGDAELNRARIYGLRKSKELRKVLRNKNSDEYLAYIPDIDTLDKEQILELLVIMNVQSKTLDVARDINIPKPKEPSSDASLEEQENYQDAIDNYPELREKMIKEELVKLSEKVREKLQNLSKDELFKEYESEIINKICEIEMVTKFRQMCVYFGCYKDAALKVRLFDNFEQYENLPSDIKEQLDEYYMSLEIGGEDLKNLLDQTQ